MTKYYAAAPSSISTDPIFDGIEITIEQYNEALTSLTNPEDNRIISTEGGVFALVEPPVVPEPEPEPPTQEEIIGAFRRAIQSHVDDVARTHKYDSGTSLASYVSSTNTTWAAEAVAFVAWRDLVWAYAYTELDKVQNELREVPTIEEFISELPSMVWPEEV